MGKPTSIKGAVVLVEMSDGNLYQVLLNRETEDVILSAILASEEVITVLEGPLEGIILERHDTPTTHTKLQESQGNQS